MTEQRIERRLAAILAADVAGYSRLVGEDEQGTLDRLRSFRSEVIDPHIRSHGGRIVKTTGDGLLAEFPSVVEALRCAVEVQRQLADRNAPIAPERRLEFRLGVHQGDIVVEDGDIFGDDVNVAARLEGQAEPGGICVSARVREDAAGKLDLVFEDLGELALKNIARPVRAYRLNIGQAPAAPRHPVLALPDKPSIAVLPFANMSGDPEQDYFADGMVEDITSSLARFKWLFVISRNSAFTYKGRTVDVRQVGRELGVRYVLEGSVRKSAGRVRITAQLADTETRTHLWGERYDRAIDDIFALQDEITVSTVAAIEPSLRSAEIERAKRKRPENLDAYDLFLQAMPYSDTLMPDGAAHAVPLLERALALDPTYAAAHGQIAVCHEILYVRAGRREENRLAAIRHGHSAIALGPDDAEALTLGAIAVGMVEHDRAMAREAFEAALAHCPSAASAYLWGSLILGWGAEAELALEWAEKGIRLSPLDPWIICALHGMFLAHFARGRFEEAATAARRAIRSKPGFSISHMMLAGALARMGRLDEARSAAGQVLSLQPNFSSSGHCASVGAVELIAGPLVEALRAAGLPE